MPNIRDLAEGFKNYSADIRREFHMYPEKSFMENRTSTRIMEELDNMGI